METYLHIKKVSWWKPLGCYIALELWKPSFRSLLSYKAYWVALGQTFALRTTYSTLLLGSTNQAILWRINQFMHWLKAHIVLLHQSLYRVLPLCKIVAGGNPLSATAWIEFRNALPVNKATLMLLSIHLYYNPYHSTWSFKSYPL